MDRPPGGGITLHRKKFYFGIIQIILTKIDMKFWGFSDLIKLNKANIEILVKSIPLDSRQKKDKS